MAMIDAVGEVAVIDLQHRGSEFHQRNVLGLSGLQMQEARPFVDALFNLPTTSETELIPPVFEQRGILLGEERLLVGAHQAV
jgi:hypothetical protein